MAKANKVFIALLGAFISLAMTLQINMTAEAGGNFLEAVNGGVASILDPGSVKSADLINATAKQLNYELFSEKEEESLLVMANVKSSLNIRSIPENGAEKIGKLYKDCGGVVLERENGWTLLQSGNLIGWANDKYLLFGEDAEELANNVGIMTATVVDDTLRVRSEANQQAEVLGFLPKGEIVEVLGDADSKWICIDYNGQDGYVLSEYVKTDFVIDQGETNEEIKARQKAEREAKRNVNYGAYTTDADSTLLLAALIQCEAGGESYEGQVAVGAVVMNRVRSGAYPDSIHGVIYASGQFTPACNGKVNKVYESGKINSSCIQAAEEALAGTSNVGSCTHFRRNNGRDGIVLGNHVFY